MEQNRNDVLSAAFNKARNMIQKDSANNIGNSLGNISSVFDTVTNTPSYSMNEKETVPAFSWPWLISEDALKSANL